MVSFPLFFNRPSIFSHMSYPCHVSALRTHWLVLMKCLVTYCILLPLLLWLLLFLLVVLAFGDREGAVSWFVTSCGHSCFKREFCARKMCWTSGRGHNRFFVHFWKATEALFLSPIMTTETTLGLKRILSNSQSQGGVWGLLTTI